jgi:hypothetical protein
MLLEILKPEIVKPVQNGIESPNLTVVLPIEVSDVIRLNPAVKTLISEMAVTNPSTFLHQVMTLEAYRRICDGYVSKCSFPSINAKINFISLLRSREEGVLLHDLGKWGLDPDVEKSVNIINSIPPDGNGSNSDNGRYIDHRTPTEQTLHRLHPLTGGLMAIELAHINPPLPLKVDTKGVIFSHHEQINGHQTTANGRNLLSYPRSISRETAPMEKLASTLVKIADTLIASGQPRIYKGRHHDGLIMADLSEFLTDGNLESIFGKLSEQQKLALRNTTMDIAFSALHSIQRKYPEDLCLNVRNFTLNGHVLEAQSLNSMQNASALIWQKHLARLEQTADTFLKSIKA